MEEFTKEIEAPITGSEEYFKLLVIQKHGRVVLESTISHDGLYGLHVMFLDTEIYNRIELHDDL